MRRREFIILVGSTAMWPIAARAQQQRMQVIGWLDNGGQAANPNTLAAFHKGLNEIGFVEGRNVAIEFRVTEENDRLPALAAELVRRQVAVIYVTGNANSAQAAKAATATIPIVFFHGSDPVRLGLVASLNRPGGNVTGVTNYAGELAPKRLELLRELVPRATSIAFLINPSNARAEGDRSDMQAAARSVGQQITIVSASTENEINTAFATVGQQQAGALLVTGDAFFYSRRDQIVALAARYAIPTSYDTREFATAGGLISYGDDRLETLRQSGLYVGRILKGEKPADLPVMQPSRFELVVNLKTAKAIGLTIPETFLVRADEVIE